MEKDGSIRLIWATAVIILVVPLLLRLTTLLSTPERQLRNIVEFIFDDGYYYLTIAANIADTGRSSFDGITVTNGYQPLWLLMLVGLAKLTGTRAHVLFVACCSLVYALACGAPVLALMWWRTPRRYLALCLGAGVAMVTIQQPVVFLEGLESILLLPLMIPLVMALEDRRSNRPTLLRLSGLLAVAFLVRLDMLALYASVMLCLLTAEMQGGRWREAALVARLARIGLGLSLVVVPTVLVYAGVNRWLFGSPVPVSGLAKMIGGPHFSNWGAVKEFFRWSYVPLLGLLLLLEALSGALGCRPKPIFHRTIIILSVAAALQCFYYAAFSSWYLWPWYTSLVAIDMGVVIARIIYLSALIITSGYRRAVPAGVAVLLLLGLWASYRGLSYGIESLPPALQGRLWQWSGRQPDAQKPGAVVSFNQLSLDMLDSFFTGSGPSIIAMGDRAGGLAYWGRGRVEIVQTEGLTLDIGYLHARMAEQGAQYLRQFPIQYLVADREVFPTLVDGDGHVQFVVPEPIQGRITTAAVPTFCFPSQAVRYRRSYQSVYGPNTRIAFAFADQVPCSQAALALIGTIQHGIGLRQYSLPSEYDTAGGPLSKRSEDRDRHYR